MVKMGAFLYLMSVGIQKVIGFLLYAVGTGFTMTYAGTLYFVYLFVTTLIIGWLLSNASEKTLAERGNIDTKWFSTKATLENTFLESTARIQTDRNQTYGRHWRIKC